MSKDGIRGFPEVDEKKGAGVSARSRTSSSSSTLSLKTPRTARFAEATSVNSPIEPSAKSRSPFSGPPIVTTHYLPEPQVSDVGFDYMSSDQIKHTSVEMPMTPKTPMRSALKVPGTPGRFLDPRSPTFNEEMALEKQELSTEKQNAKDFKQKKRVRIAKFFLRGVNFSCSLIVLSMLSTTMTIFNATKTLPSRSNLPPWALGSQTWPQIVLLVVSSVSLAICILVFYSYWRGGHRKAKKTTVYYTYFSIGIFLFSTIMWIFAAAVLHSSRANGNNQDIWGWSCNDVRRATLFQDEVNYALVCRLQNWSLICCLIEVVVEVLTIAIYAVVLWRFISKRKLHKSMDQRDKARSDLYLAQLRTQSAPNTPGFAARTPGAASFKSPLGASFPKHFHDSDSDSISDADRIEKIGGEAADREYEARHAQFTMGAIPPPPGVTITGATPVVGQGEFVGEQSEKVQEHVPAAPGEQVYEAVPIPGAHAAPVLSPGFAPAGGMVFPGEGR